MARPETVTLPVMICRLIDRPGPVNTGMALAASTLLASPVRCWSGCLNSCPGFHGWRPRRHRGRDRGVLTMLAVSSITVTFPGLTAVDRSA